jgi:hypothetical protein
LSAAKVSESGVVTSLDGRAEPDEVITENDVQDAAKLARALSAMSKAIAALKRAWAPRTIDFEDVLVATSGAAVHLAHGFGRVRWWVIDWVPTSPGTVAPILFKSDATTEQTLVLLSYVDGTATIRVEEAG